jgi:hypothetical protein
VAALGAIASYMPPLDNIIALAFHNNANANASANARAALASNSAHTSKTNPAGGSGSSASSKKSGDTTFSNGNSTQLGGKTDNGNIGRCNTDTGNTGNGNSANNDQGNGNNAPGQTGDFYGNGKGHHYGCLANNPHA